MERKTISRLLGCFLGFILLLPLTLRAQNTPQKSGDPELERVQALIRQARKEAEQFLASGGKASDVNHPNIKWSATFWQYRGEHPSAPATDLATGEALRLLVRVDHIDEMQAKADTLKPDDAAWKQVINSLMDAATNRGDYGYIISKAQALLEQSTDPEIELRARFTLGKAYWKKGDAGKAKAAFQAVITRHPNTTYAESAEGNLMEMEKLNLGQPAPLFASRTINGEPISLADFEGKVVALKFWASWCRICVGEVPLFKDLEAKYKDQGFVIVGISLDEDLKALQEMVSSKGITWPQVWDSDGAIVKLFNVKGTPTYFVLDRDGKIAAKRIPAQELNDAIANLLKK